MHLETIAKPTAFVALTQQANSELMRPMPYASHVAVEGLMRLVGMYSLRHSGSLVTEPGPC